MTDKGADDTAIETYKGFLKLGTRVWVRGDAIVVIRSRPLPDDKEGAEVLVKGQQATNASQGYAVWTSYAVKAIIDATINALNEEAQRLADEYRAEREAQAREANEGTAP